MVILQIPREAVAAHPAVKPWDTEYFRYSANNGPDTPIKKSIVKTKFEDANNYMKDGVLLRQVINVISHENKRRTKWIKKEVETLNKKLTELTEEELAQVAGGFPILVPIPWLFRTFKTNWNIW